jgi:hypothetical protein
MSAVDKVIEELGGRLTDEELQELSYRVVEDVEPRQSGPLGVWRVTTKDTEAGPMNVEPENLLVVWTEMKGLQSFTVTVYSGEKDGVPVVQIDGNGLFRINVNDSAIWNADPADHAHFPCKCVHDFEEQS